MTGFSAQQGFVVPDRHWRWKKMREDIRAGRYVDHLPRVATSAIARGRDDLDGGDARLFSLYPLRSTYFFNR
ncbi:MAG: hypothetical protein QNJ85_12775 [Gammaproteobacteria bacterium]|nr:hypothetical protein [Gammaproteobacteria bacterium]